MLSRYYVYSSKVVSSNDVTWLTRKLWAVGRAKVYKMLPIFEHYWTIISNTFFLTNKTLYVTVWSMIRNEKNKTIVLFKRHCHATEKTEAIACARRCRSSRLTRWWTQMNNRKNGWPRRRGTRGRWPPKNNKIKHCIYVGRAKVSDKIQRPDGCCSN
jgi:hypothetical protein